MFEDDEVHCLDQMLNNISGSDTFLASTFFPHPSAWMAFEHLTLMWLSIEMKVAAVVLDF